MQTTGLQAEGKSFPARYDCQFSGLRRNAVSVLLLATETNSPRSTGISTVFPRPSAFMYGAMRSHYSLLTCTIMIGSMGSGRAQDSRVQPRRGASEHLGAHLMPILCVVTSFLRLRCECLGSQSN
jgi:hypothetical protein